MGRGLDNRSSRLSEVQKEHNTLCSAKNQPKLALQRLTPKSKQDAKQLLAMSLQSFGLVEAVKLVPKELWLEAIKQAYGDTL